MYLIFIYIIIYRHICVRSPSVLNMGHISFLEELDRAYEEKMRDHTKLYYNINILIIVFNMYYTTACHTRLHTDCPTEIGLTRL